MSQQEERRLYRFGEFLLDERARTLTQSRETISLTPKEFETLVLLVESAGEAVGKERLIRSVWPDTFVGDTSLARNISVLRKHLGAEAIQTVPKYGYRFSLPVTLVSGVRASPELPMETATVSATAASASGESVAVRATSRRAWLWVSGLLVLAAMSGVWGALRQRIAPKSSISKIAVLPFRNISSKASETDYLRDGLADELTSRLCRLDYNRLRVLARSSTGQYLNTSKSPAMIASELGAQYLIEGTVGFDDDKVRISAELVDGPDQTIQWSRQFIRPMAELSSVQDEIVEAVADATHVDTKPDRRTGPLTGETASVEAHNAYLQGRYELEQKTLASEQRALEQFQLAVRLDARYARAYQAISETYIFMSGYVLPQKPLTKAKNAALTAIHLNETLGEAHRDLAWTLFNENADLKGGEAEYKRAIELNPDDARAHHWYSLLLAAERRSTESVREATIGYQLDPRSVGSGYNYGFMLIEAGKTRAGVQDWRIF